MAFIEILPTALSPSMGESVTFTVQKHGAVMYLRFVVGKDIVKDIGGTGDSNYGFAFGYGPDDGMCIIRSGGKFKSSGRESATLRFSANQLGIVCDAYADPFDCEWDREGEDGITIFLPEEFKYTFNRLGKRRTDLSNVGVEDE